MTQNILVSSVIIEVSDKLNRICEWDNTFISLSELNEISEEILPEKIKNDALKELLLNKAEEKEKNIVINGKEFTVVFRKMNTSRFLVLFYEIKNNGKTNTSWADEVEILKLLSEKTNDGLWLMNANLKTVYMSPAIELHMGYRPEEYIALPIQERLPEDAIKIYQENYQKLLMGYKQNPKNDSIIFELPHKHKNGNVYWGEVSVRIIQGEDHKIEGFAGVTRNVDEKHRLQEDLKKTTAYYRAILDGFTGLVYVCSSDFRVEFMNEAFIKRIGRSAVGELCYKSLYNFNEQCPFCENLKDIEKKGRYELETQSPVDSRWYHIISVPLKVDNKTSKLSLVQDITEKKLAAQKLSESEMIFMKLAEYTPAAIFIYQGPNFVYVNPGIERLVGYSSDELMKMNFWDLVAPEHREMVMQRGLQRQQGEKIENRYDFMVLTKGGEKKWIDFTGSLIQFKGKSAAIGIAFDITDQKRYLQALSESEEKFRQMSDNIADGITIIEDKKIIYVNQRLCQITGYSEEELKKLTGFDLATSWEKERITEFSNKAKSDPKNHNFLEYCIKTKSGEERYILNRYSYSPSNINRKYIVTTDITDRIHYEKELMLKNKEIQSQNEEYRKLNDELQQSILKARESDQLKSAFIANMSHEIRTPLNAIMGFSEMLVKKNLSNEKIQDYSKVINRSGKHLLSLISDIIDISKIETGQMDLSFDAVNVNALFKDTYSFFENMSIEKGLILKVDIPAKEYNYICDQTKLQQILNNLIVNAIKFTDFGEVVFGFKVNNDKLGIFVSDTGIGIPKKDLSVIFERFRQLENGHIKKIPGTGLGLAIVKGLTDLLKGSMVVDSDLNKGTVFNLTFQFESCDENNSTARFYNEYTDYSFKGYKILIAEDEIISRMLFTEILQPTGIEIIESADGKEAIECFTEFKPDIVILDLGLPKMDGLQVCCEIRKKDQGVPVIACSAYAYNEDKEKANKAGCNDFITKPYQSDLLLGLINKYLYKVTK